MGARLAAAIRSSGRARLAVEPAANEIFAILPEDVAARLRAEGAVFHPWSVETLAPEDRPSDGETLVRLITSFQTTAEAVDEFADRLAA